MNDKTLEERISALEAEIEKLEKPNPLPPMQQERINDDFDMRLSILEEIIEDLVNNSFNKYIVTDMIRKLSDDVNDKDVRKAINKIAHSLNTRAAGGLVMKHYDTVKGNQTELPSILSATKTEASTNKEGLRILTYQEVQPSSKEEKLEASKINPRNSGGLCQKCGKIHSISSPCN